MKTNFLLLILFSIAIVSCNDSIVTECEIDTDNIKIRANYQSIQKELFDKSCIGCHSGSLPSGGLNLSSDVSFSNIKDRENGNKNMLLVKSGVADSSYLIKKLEANDGSVMPPTGKLNQAVIDTVKLWINSGAINN